MVEAEVVGAVAAEEEVAEEVVVVRAAEAILTPVAVEDHSRVVRTEDHNHAAGMCSAPKDEEQSTRRRLRHHVHPQAVAVSSRM